MAQPALTSAIRSNLNSLQSTSSLLGRTQERLATGLKVNSALDNANAFFAAKGLNGRASDLGGRLEKLGQDIQTIKAATTAIESIEGILTTVKAKITEAAALELTDAAGRTAKQTEANNLLAQARTIAEDAGYGGINLLNDTQTLTSSFNEAGDNILATVGVDYGDAAGITANFATNFATGANTDAATTAINNTLSAVRSQASSFATNLTVIEAREKFTANIIDTLEEGAGKLTLADTNEEGANLLALQTRQQLGITALSLSAQADQSVLRLF